MHRDSSIYEGRTRGEAVDVKRKFLMREVLAIISISSDEGDALAYLVQCPAVCTLPLVYLLEVIVDFIETMF